MIPFRGEASVSIELISGPGRAVSLMMTRGWCSGDLKATTRSEWERGGVDQGDMIVDLGEVVAQVRIDCGTPLHP